MEPQENIKIAGILLAAGMSSRMGQNKLLMPYGDSTIVKNSIARMAESDVDHLFLITGHDRSAITEAVIPRYENRISVLHNEKYRQGHLESVKCALRNLDRSFSAALFMVADKPNLTTELINRAISAFRSQRPCILYVETPHGRGHPIIFASPIFDDIIAYEGDRMADFMIDKYKDRVYELNDGRVQFDIDTPTDFEKLTAGSEKI